MRSIARLWRLSATDITIESRENHARPSPHPDDEALVNTVNTEGVMGKGIALQFKKKSLR